jgi:predicted Kef-type K+ transport protein
VLAATVAMLLLSAAATHLLGLEAVLGAFVCGTVMGSCGELDRVRLAPLRHVTTAVLAPVFFATAGLRMDLTALARPAVLGAAMAVLLIATVGKFSGAYIGARLSRLSRWEALALGAGLNARGVIEVVVAMVGLRLGVLSAETYTIVVLVAIATSLMAPPVLRFALGRVALTAEEHVREEAYSDGQAAPPTRLRAQSAGATVARGPLLAICGHNQARGFVRCMVPDGDEARSGHGAGTPPWLQDGRIPLTQAAIPIHPAYRR